MKANYTYEDVMKKAASYGLLDSMTDADKNLTLRNPDAGMTVLQSRYDYKTASTAEAKALAHVRAEKARNQYGGYSGGADGSKFYVTDISPIHYAEETAPTFNDRYAEKERELTEKINDRPAYVSPYEEQRKSLTGEISSSADPASLRDDKAYQAYAKQYRREGNRAIAEALGSAATLTGGIPSSAAVTAASQAGDYYATQLADKLPTLQSERQAMLLKALNALETEDNTAYQRYLDESAMDYDKLELLRALRSDDYNQYRDELARYETDRDFDYNQFVDDLEYNSNIADKELAQKNYKNELAAEQKRYDQQLSAEKEEQLWNAAVYAYQYLDDASLLKRLIKEMKGA